MLLPQPPGVLRLQMDPDFSLVATTPEDEEAVIFSSSPLGGNERWEPRTQCFLQPPASLLPAASISQMNAVENVFATSREFQVLSPCFWGETNKQTNKNCPFM